MKEEAMRQIQLHEITLRSTTLKKDSPKKKYSGINLMKKIATKTLKFLKRPQDLDHFLHLNIDPKRGKPNNTSPIRPNITRKKSQQFITNTII